MNTYSEAATGAATAFRFLASALAVDCLPLASNSLLAVTALAWNGVSTEEAEIPDASEGIVGVNAPAGRGLSLAPPFTGFIAHETCRQFGA